MEEENRLNLKGDMISSTVQISLVGVWGGISVCLEWKMCLFVKRTVGCSPLEALPKKSDDAQEIR